MGVNSNIEWTDATWNPIRGCSRVSEGCRNCYAEHTAARFSGPGKPYEGLARIENVQRPDGSTLTTRALWTGEVRFIEERLEDPLHWRRPRRIFVNSMSDLFHERVSLDALIQIFAVIQACPQHIFQILTKRPARMLEVMADKQFEDLVSLAGVELADQHCWCHAYEDADWPLKQVWLGVSVEDQATADERIPLLLQTPAAVRWVSYEPALGPVGFTHIQHDGTVEINALTGDHGVYRPLAGRSDARLDWIVAGGESGTGARPTHPAWFRDVRDQCVAAGVPFFFKQWGQFSPDAGLRVGKKAAGRLLDGREWNDFPATVVKP